MIHKAKDLSREQKVAIESLLGHVVTEDEAIVICAVSSVPEWLQGSWESAGQKKLDLLTAEEIESEIASARRARPNQLEQ
jgi:hypothetical protein